MPLHVYAPVTGRVVATEDIPDPVFSAGLVGPGVAIDPDHEAGRVAVAPIAGRLVKLHPHAFVVAGADGRGVLVHLGIDTVQLKGEGFTLHAAEGDEVEAGQHLVTWSPSDVVTGGRSPVVPVVALDVAVDLLVPSAVEESDVVAGEELFTIGG
jgi:PTS system glucose-specific IIA component